MHVSLAIELAKQVAMAHALRSKLSFTDSKHVDIDINDGRACTMPHKFKSECVLLIRIAHFTLLRSVIEVFGNLMRLLQFLSDRWLHVLSLG